MSEFDAAVLTISLLMGVAVIAAIGFSIVIQIKDAIDAERAYRNYKPRGER